MRGRVTLGILRQGVNDLAEDLAIVSRRLGKKGKVAHPTVLLDMSSVALTLLRASIAFRKAFGGSLGTRSALKWIFRVDVWTDDIGPRLTLPHPFNIVIGSGVRIDQDCTILHNTTIQHAEKTRIGEGALLATGVVVLRNVDVGAGAACGANAVVTRDVSSGQTVVGIPAEPIRSSQAAG